MKLSLPAAKTWHGGWWSYPGHRGQDFGWGDGDQVMAAAPGTVVEIYGGGGYNGGWGNRIVISHGGGNYTTYNHLATGTIGVSNGSEVSRGQIIARMGSTGESTAKHLHFELEIGGRSPNNRVDPAPYYSRDLPGTDTPLAPHERRVTSGGPANGRSEPSTSSPVVQQIPGDDTGEFDGWIRGESVSGNNVWYRGKFSKNWFWSGSFTNTGTSGLADLNPKPPTDPTKRVTNDVVRVRQQPTTASTHVKTYDANTTHTIMGWKNGEAVEGIKEWFRTVDGWVWSDGFTNRSTAGLTDLNTGPEPEPEPTPDPADFTPNIVTPSARDYPAWIRYEEKLKAGVTTQRNVEDADYYGKKYNPGESHVHWWGEPGKSGTHDSNVAYLNGSKDVDANFVISAGRVTLTVPLNIIAYTTGQRNPYGWKSENDPALTELGYKTLGYVHYIVEKLNPKLLNEPIRLHKEFSATSCSGIDVARVREYAEKFRSGALDPSTGEPPIGPDPDPQPQPDYRELVEALNRMSDKIDSLNAKLDSIYNL